MPVATISAAQLFRPVRAFICHSSSDRHRALEIYKRLRRDGFEPWMDEVDLIPGMDWKQEIARAVKITDVVLVCISKNLSRPGFVQRELTFALELAYQQPEDAIFIIPLKLEPCTIPERLSKWQAVDYFSPEGYKKLINALNARSRALQQESMHLELRTTSRDAPQSTQYHAEAVYQAGDVRMNAGRIGIGQEAGSSNEIVQEGDTIYIESYNASVLVAGEDRRKGQDGRGQFVVESKAELSGRDLTSINLADADLSEANLRGTNLQRVVLERSNLERAILRHAKLQYANLNNAYLGNANLSGAVLYGADLTNADLRSARLDRADLRDASLERANLDRAILRHADLEGAKLNSVYLGHANLRRANLRNADLSNADLRNATLDEADFTGADLSRANLEGANGTDLQLYQAMSLSGTIWPDGLIRYS